MSIDFVWDENKATANLSKHAVSFDKAKTVFAEPFYTDDLRPEYDLKSLRVRKVGPQRAGFGGQWVQLAPDVAEVFPDAESVNEALRFLIRITREHKPSLSAAGKGA